MARRSHSSQNRGRNNRDRREDAFEYDTEDFAQDDYDAYDQGAYQPRTLGSVRSAGASSARNNHESHGSRFTREPLIGQTNVGDEWPEEAPAQQQKHTHFAAHRAGAVSHAPSRAEGVSAYSKKRQGSSRGRGLKIFAGILGTLLLVAGVAFAWWMLDTNSKLRQGLDANLQATLVQVAPSDPFYMLLLGVDKDEGRAENWGDSDANFRADTIILARVDPKNKKITLISIPRDTMVDLGEHGKQKINSAYSYGGASGMVEAVSKLANVNISHYAEVDFESFTKIVDSIGGITVNLPVAVSDMQYSGIDLPAGEQQLNGQQALGLSRSRHAYDNYGAGDFYRAANQRMILTAIAKKVLQLDPVSMSGAVSTMAESVTTDLNVTDIVGLAMSFRGMDTSKDMYSARTPTTSELIDDVWYEIVDKSAWKTMMDRVNQALPPLEDASADETTGVVGTVGGDPSAIDSIKPDYTGEVAVLNGTDVQGLAAQKAGILKTKGYTAYADSSLEHPTDSIVVYDGTRTGLAKAVGVAKALDIPTANIKANDGSYPTDVDITVVLGTDQAPKR